MEIEYHLGAHQIQCYINLMMTREDALTADALEYMTRTIPEIQE